MIRTFRFKIGVLLRLFFVASVASYILLTACIQTRAPILGVDNPVRIPDKYFVIFKESVKRVEIQAVADALVRHHPGTTIHHMYTVVNGFAATLSTAALEEIRTDPRVKYIEAVGVVRKAD